MRASQLPLPRRGDVVRQLGDELRACKHDLGRLLALEVGKIIPEGEGEVQECKRPYASSHSGVFWYTG